jgi:hypothetical protein
MNKSFYEKLYDRCVQKIKAIDDNNLDEQIFRQNLLNTMAVCLQKLANPCINESERQKGLNLTNICHFNVIKIDNKVKQNNGKVIDSMNQQNKCQVINDKKNVNKICAQESRHSKVIKINNKINGFKSIDKKINKNNKLFKCPFIGCKKIIAFENSFINHKKQHLLRNSNKAKNCQSIDLNESIDKANEKKSQNNFSSDPNYKGLQSLENLSRYFAIKTINGKKQFICKYSNDCKLK